MASIFRKATLAAVLTASVGLAAAPAEARGGYYYRHHGGGDDAAIAVGAGILGLAVGAAIASDHDRRYDRYYYRDGYSYPRYRGYYQGYPTYRAYPNRYYRGYDRDYYRDGYRGYQERRYYYGY
jgi:hypothetical protein